MRKPWTFCSQMLRRHLLVMTLTTVKEEEHHKAVKRRCFSIKTQDEQIFREEPTSISWYNPLKRKNPHLQWRHHSFHRESTPDGIYSSQPPAEMTGRSRVIVYFLKSFMLNSNSSESRDGRTTSSIKVKRHNGRKRDCEWEGRLPSGHAGSADKKTKTSS